MSDREGWQAMHESKKARRDRNVEKTRELLDSMGLTYYDTDIPNVVFVEEPKIFMSLKRKHGSIVKVRFDGDYKWYYYKTPAFRERFGIKNK